MAGPVVAPSGLDGKAHQELTSALARCFILAASALWLVLALLLAGRRLAGALAVPLGVRELLVVGVVQALAATGLRAAWQEWAPPVTRPWIGTFARCAPSAALWITAGTVSLRGAPAVGLAGCWALVIAAEIWNWRSRSSPPASSGLAAEPPGGIEPSRSHRPVVRPWREDQTQDEDENDVFQRLTRARDPEGRDVLYGTLRADLAADQRMVAFHVAFCPPFATTPSVDVEQTSGPDVRIKLGQVLPYGARLDARLVRAPRQPSSVVVGIHVQAADTEPALRRPF